QPDDPSGMVIGVDAPRHGSVEGFGKRPGREEPEIDAAAGREAPCDRHGVGPDSGPLVQERAGVDRDSHGAQAIRLKPRFDAPDGAGKMRGSTMKHPESLSLESVLDEPLRFAGELEVPVSAIDREPLLTLSPLKLEGEVRRIEGGYALDARLVYDGELECSRCLAAYPFRED